MPDHVRHDVKVSAQPASQQAYEERQSRELQTGPLRRADEFLTPSFMLALGIRPKVERRGHPRIRKRKRRGRPTEASGYSQKPAAGNLPAQYWLTRTGSPKKFARRPFLFAIQHHGPRKILWNFLPRVVIPGDLAYKRDFAANVFPVNANLRPRAAWLALRYDPDPLDTIALQTPHRPHRQNSSLPTILGLHESLPV